MSKSEKEDFVLAASALTLGSIFIALPVHGGGFVVGGVAASGGTSYVVAYVLGGVTSGLVGFVARDSISWIHGISKIYADSNAGPRMSCVHTEETTSATRLSTTVQRLQRSRGSMQVSAQRRCERAFGYRVLCRCDQLDPVQVIQTTCEWEAQPGRGVRLQGRGQKAPAGCQWVLSSLQYVRLHKDVHHTQSADAPRSQTPLDLLSLKHKHPLQIHPVPRLLLRNDSASHSLLPVLLISTSSLVTHAEFSLFVNLNKAITTKKDDIHWSELRVEYMQSIPGLPPNLSCPNVPMLAL
ncbi:UNVERIFIED_CONTAM: hypothetical protein PYX00_011573 [Menopon gallinae]|uniref:Uncharacterized protein n=1 Tax=Menopon gallinae TaxID=328185 RepID=A0AAW2H827_9NEOP